MGLKISPCATADGTGVLPSFSLQSSTQRIRAVRFLSTVQLTQSETKTDSNQDQNSLLGKSKLSKNLGASESEPQICSLLAHAVLQFDIIILSSWLQSTAGQDKVIYREWESSG